MRVAALLVLLLTFPAFGASHVRARLIADSAPTPGKSFNVGVLLTIDDGWHVYWKYPGDAGMATTVNLHLPDGWKAGEWQYPVPIVMQQGEVLSYGYERQVMLICPVTPSTNASASPEISATVSFLVCRELCMPGRLKVSLEQEPDPKLIAQWQAKVPTQRLDVDWMPATATSDGWTQLRGMIPGLSRKDVQWFPDLPKGLMIQHIHVSPQEISFQVKKEADAILKEKSFDSVLSYDVAGQREGVRVNVPLELK